MARKVIRRKSGVKRKRRRISGNPSLAPSVISGTRRKKRRNTVYKSVRSHARRVKGMGKLTGSDAGDMLLGTLLGVGAGIALDVVVKKVSALAGKEKIVSVAKTIIGAAGALKMKKPLLKGMGLGLAAQGAYTGAQSFGVIQGMEEFMRGVGNNADDSMLIEMNGMDDVNINSTNIIGGTNMPMPSVIGNDDDDMSDDEGVSGEMPSVIF